MATSMLVVVAVLVCSVAWAQHEPPVVAVTFAIDDSAFTTYDDATRAAIETEFSATLATHCGTHFGFLTWRPAPEAGPNPAAELIVRLTQSDTQPSSIHLQYSATVGGEDRPLPGFDSEELYAFWEDQPTHDPERLKERLTERIAARFTSEGVRQPLHEHFLRWVPLTSEIHVDRDDERVVVPLLWDLLRPATDSRLHIEFKVRSDGELKDGSIEVGAAGEEDAEEWRGFLECMIISFAFPGFDAHEWTDKIPEIVTPEQLESLGVFMTVYVRNLSPETSGKKAMSP